MKQTDSIIDKILTASPEQLEEISAGIEVIMNGGSEADARTALVALREKRRPVTRLERARILTGYTVEKLSEISGVPASVISGIESGAAGSASGKDILSLAKALNIDASDLFN